jgi:FKBP-type peptidyl-prolyl cis-trans isomerase
MSFRKLFFIVSISVFIVSCKDQTPVSQVVQRSNGEIEEETPLMRGNRKKVRLEDENIDLFLKRYGWEMIKTETGLRYEILKKGKGVIPKEGDLVELQYITQFLTGDTVYTSHDKGNITFHVQKTDQIVGLHEAVQLFPKGTKARLVIPSHLAYGISGDGDRIIGQKTLVMTIEINEK